jgi:hypothetical protein
MLIGYRSTQMVYVAAKLGIADLLGAGPRSIDDLVRATGADAWCLYRVMRGFVLYGLVAHRTDGSFELTAAGECLRTDAPRSLREEAISIGEVFWPAWGALLHTVRTGEVAFEHAFGLGFFEYVARYADAADRFHRAIFKGSLAMADAILEAYDFSASRTLVDVGGGYGGFLTAVLEANPHLKGVLFDLPATAGEAEAYLRAAGVLDRGEVVAGDFFDSVPAGGDTYFVKWTLHDWGDEQVVRILKNCHRAMAGRGKLLVVEWVMPERVDRSTAAVETDLTMLVDCGGCERTEAEFRRLLSAAGFRLTQVIPTGCGRCVIESLPE